MFEKIKINSIKGAEYNPRFLSEEARLNLIKSFNDFGQIKPIIVRKENNTIVAGHQRTKILKELGFEEPCFGFYGLSRDDYKTIRLSIFQNLKTDYLPDIHHLDVTCDAPLYQQAFRFFQLFVLLTLPFSH